MDIAYKENIKSYHSVEVRLPNNFYGMSTNGLPVCLHAWVCDMYVTRMLVNTSIAVTIKLYHDVIAGSD